VRSYTEEKHGIPQKKEEKHAWWKYVVLTQFLCFSINIGCEKKHG
jgi:hypothetical protein